MKTKELLYIFVPTNIPYSSKIDDEIKGYVETNPLVKIFLLATFFISLLFLKRGSVERYPCSSLKYALLVCIPRLCAILCLLNILILFCLLKILLNKYTYSKFLRCLPAFLFLYILRHYN